MTRKQVAEIIKSMGYPFVYYAWRVDHVPDLPYVVYYYPQETPEAADDSGLVTIARLNIELYTNQKSIADENKVERVLNDNDMPFNKSEAYLDSEQMYEVLYETEVVINGAD